MDQSGGPDACWPWTASRHKRQGYGRFYPPERPNGVQAHGYALLLAVGPPPEQFADALHSCDNPPCCNPAHLRWGTHAENMQDMELRGRRSSSTLTPGAVAHIRAASAELRRALAEEHGVSLSTISEVLTGKTWWYA